MSLSDYLFSDEFMIGVSWDLDGFRCWVLVGFTSGFRAVLLKSLF